MQTTPTTTTSDRISAAFDRAIFTVLRRKALAAHLRANCPCYAGIPDVCQQQCPLREVVASQEQEMTSCGLLAKTPDLKPSV
jgi:hypothetical protein